MSKRIVLVLAIFAASFAVFATVWQGAVTETVSAQTVEPGPVTLPIGDLPPHLMRVEGIVEGTTEPVLVQLVDPDGNVIQETPAKATGQFLFPEITRRTYQVQVVNRDKDILELREDVAVLAADHANQHLLVTLASQTDAPTEEISSEEEGVVQSETIRSAPTATGTIGFNLSHDAYVEIYDASDDRYLGDHNTRYEGITLELAAGDYKFNFDPNTSWYENYVEEWFDNQRSIDNATVVTVGDGTQQTLTVEFDVGGTIAGTVFNADTNEPVHSVYVEAYSSENERVTYDYTGSDGTYELDELQPGEVRLKFVNYDGSYLTEWYEDAVDYASATPITVVLSETISNVDAYIQLGGVITGTIRDADTNQPVPGVFVEAYSSEDERVAYDYADSNGVYVVEGLEAGDIRLQFADTYNSVYFSEWYDDAETYALATPISIAPNQTIPNIDAAIQRGGELSGTVFTSGGMPITDTRVYVYTSTQSTYSIEQDYISVSDQGQYRFDGLATGTYFLEFVPDSVWNSSLGYSVRQVWAPEYHDGKATLVDADGISVTAGQSTNVDATLELGGVLKGRITADDNGEPLESVRVRVEGLATDVYASVSTDSSGYYEIVGLPADNYRIEFDASWASEYLDEYYNRVFDAVDSTPVEIALGETETLDYSLRKGGVIVGRVTALDTGNPLEDIYVQLYEPPSGVDCYYDGNVADSTYTDASGYYTFTRLLPNTYDITIGTLDYRRPDNDESKAYMPTSSDDIVVEAGDTIQVNSRLERGGQYSGVVTAEDTGNPLAGVRVSTYQWNYYAPGDYYWWSHRGDDYTDETGAFVSPGLYGGDYAVTFSTSPYDDAPAKYYVDETWNNQEGSYYYADNITLITITDGELETGIDVALARGGTVTGRVIAGDTGDPLEWVYPDVYRVLEDGSLRYVEGHRTQASGVYTITGIPQGEYIVGFETVYWSDETASYIDEYFDDKPSASAANVITVSAGLTTTEVNASLARGGSIEGTVRDVDGNLIRYLSAVLYDSNGDFVTYDDSDYDGSYAFRGLRPGTYYVMFQSAYDYDQEGEDGCPPLIRHGHYYGGGSTFDTAMPVEVVGTNTTTGIDGVLGNADSWPIYPNEETYPVSGNITDENNQPLSDVVVQSNTGVASATDASGNYTLALRNGSYVLTPEKVGFNFTPVTRTVTVDGEDQSGFDFSGSALPSTASVSGNVMGDESGRVPQPLAGARVTLLQWVQNSWEFAATASTDAVGDYSFVDLFAGDYRIQFSHQGYISEYYDDALAFADAETLTLTAGEAYTDADAVIIKQADPEVVVDGGQTIVDPVSGEVTVRVPRGGSQEVTIVREATCEVGAPLSVYLIVGTARFEMSAIGDDQYRVTLTTDDLPAGSSHNMQVEVTCDVVVIIDVGSIQLYDPSGYITDANTGAAIEGATVMLYRVDGATPDTSSTTGDCRTVDTRPADSSGQFGAWSGVPSASIGDGYPVSSDLFSGGFSPEINPQVTGSDGYYGWDVALGCWYVVVEAEGYLTAISPMVGVPPEVTDLDIALKPAAVKLYLPVIVR